MSNPTSNLQSLLADWRLTQSQMAFEKDTARANLLQACITELSEALQVETKAEPDGPCLMCGQPRTAHKLRGIFQGMFDPRMPTECPPQVKTSCLTSDASRIDAEQFPEGRS